MPIDTPIVDEAGGLSKFKGGENVASGPSHYLAVFCSPKHELVVFYGR